MNVLALRGECELCVLRHCGKVNGVPKSSKQKHSAAPKRAAFPALLTLGVGITALIGFIVLDRKMAPPFPNFATNSAGRTDTATEMTTNAPGNWTNESRTIQIDPNATGLEDEKDAAEVVAELIQEGNAALESGKAGAAIAKYRKAVETQPEDEDARFNLGIALARAGKLEEAKKEYEKALEIFPDYAEVHNNLGNLLMNEGKFDAAIGHFKKAIATTPDNYSAQNNYGTALARQGNVTEAVTRFAEAIRLKPDYLQARLNLANAYAGLKRMDEAAEQLGIALQIDPNFQPAQRAMAKLRRRMAQ